jgi:hypothetical protein
MATVITLLVTPAAQASSSGAAYSNEIRSARYQAESAAPERCRSARTAAVYYRLRTHTWQTLHDGRLASRSPVVAGKSCHWAKFAAAEWKARAHSARRSYGRWLRIVGQVVTRLERGLVGSPMAGTGVILEREGRKHGVSPYFMAATAATESSLGHAACSNNRFNAWGLANCTGIWYVPSFRSWDEAIAFYAKFLSSRWPSHSTPYSFSGYAACDDCWARKVSSWMGTLFGVPARTRYP